MATPTWTSAVQEKEAIKNEYQLSGQSGQKTKGHSPAGQGKPP